MKFKFIRILILLICVLSLSLLAENADSVRRPVSVDNMVSVIHINVSPSASHNKNVMELNTALCEWKACGNHSRGV